MSENKKVKFETISFEKPTKTERINPLDSVDTELRKDFEKIKSEQGIDACYDALIKVYGSGMSEQINNLISS